MGLHCGLQFAVCTWVCTWHLGLHISHGFALCTWNCSLRSCCDCTDADHLTLLFILRPDSSACSFVTHSSLFRRHWDLDHQLPLSMVVTVYACPTPKGWAGQPRRRAQAETRPHTPIVQTVHINTPLPCPIMPHCNGARFGFPILLG